MLVLGEMPRPCTRCLLPSHTPQRLFQFRPAPAEASRGYRNACEAGVRPLVSVARSRVSAHRLISWTIVAWRKRLCGAAMAVGVTSSQGLLCRWAPDTETKIPTEPAPWEMLSGPGDALPDAPGSSACAT